MTGKRTRHPLALPLGELSPKVTERAFHPCFPSSAPLRSAASPIGRGKRCSSLSHCACQLADTPRPLRRNSPYSSQISHYLTGQNQTGYGGDKGCAARNATAVGAVALGAGRADAVRPTADGHVLILFLDKMIKATPHNYVRESQPSFCSTSAVPKTGNTYSIPPFSEL